jgi:hypothetical protein
LEQKQRSLICEIFHAAVFGLISISRCGFGDNILVAFDYSTLAIILSELWQVVEKAFFRDARNDYSVLIEIPLAEYQSSPPTMEVREQESMPNKVNSRDELIIRNHIGIRLFI